MRYAREVVLDMDAATPSIDGAVAPPSTPKIASATPAITVPASAKSNEIKTHGTVHPRTQAQSKVIAKTKSKKAFHAVPHKLGKTLRRPRSASPQALYAPKPFASVAPILAKNTAPQIDAKNSPLTSAAVRSGFLTKPSAGKQLLPADSSHTPQGTTR
jgi:hypothetical protein